MLDELKHCVEFWRNHTWVSSVESQPVVMLKENPSKLRDIGYTKKAGIVLRTILPRMHQFNWLRIPNSPWVNIGIRSDIHTRVKSCNMRQTSEVSAAGHRCKDVFDNDCTRRILYVRRKDRVQAFAWTTEGPRPFGYARWRKSWIKICNNLAQVVWADMIRGPLVIPAQPALKVCRLKYKCVSFSQAYAKSGLFIINLVACKPISDAYLG